MVDHSLHHPKVEGLSPAMAACTVRESAENSSRKALLKLIKEPIAHTSEAYTVKNLPFGASSSSDTVVKQAL